MTNWFVRINHRKESKYEFYTEQVERTLYFDVATKKEVLTKIKEDYPEYFTDKVPQRTSNGEFFFVNVYELDDKWEAFWTEKIPCTYCKENPVSRIEIKNNDYNGSYFCCQDHKEKYSEEKAKEDTRIYENNGIKGYIYKITEKATGKVYIGKTINHPVFRWFQHYKAESNSRFHDAIKNSNLSDWTFEVIEEMREGDDTDLLSLESKYISAYNSTNPEFGYNTKK